VIEDLLPCFLGLASPLLQHDGRARRAERQDGSCTDANASHRPTPRKSLSLADPRLAQRGDCLRTTGRAHVAGARFDGPREAGRREVDLYEAGVGAQRSGGL
jgi:hypothetical protein